MDQGDEELEGEGEGAHEEPEGDQNRWSEGQSEYLRAEGGYGYGDPSRPADHPASQDRWIPPAGIQRRQEWIGWRCFRESHMAENSFHAFVHRLRSCSVGNKYATTRLNWRQTSTTNNNEINTKQ